ncbi:MAG: hypothetical protein M1609_01115 [Firmicutes bacterium]|nr:hypothetical protein [Bacillota bacterium]
MRKKGIAWLVLMLALCLTLTLVAGCGGTKKEPAGQQTGQQGEKKEQPKEAAKDDKYPSRTIEVINQFGPGGGG